MASEAVAVELGGKSRRLKYTLYSISELGEKLGLRVRLNHLEEDLLSHELPLSALAVLVWAGLVHEDESLTVDQVAKWVDQDNAAEVFRAFFSLFGDRLSGTARTTLGKKLGVPESEPEMETSPT